VEICSRCGGAVKVIADTSDRCIEDQQVIDKILSHLKKKEGLPLSPDALPEASATTENPRPASPARAASIAAFRAKRFVCSARQTGTDILNF
jgi:hypothetical protein